MKAELDLPDIRIQVSDDNAQEVLDRLGDYPECKLAVAIACHILGRADPGIEVSIIESLLELEDYLKPHCPDAPINLMSRVNILLRGASGIKNVKDFESRLSLGFNHHTSYNVSLYVYCGISS